MQILDIFVRGPLAQGGIIDKDSQVIYLHYNCLRGGISSVQMTIEMDHFKNVNIFFEKECPLISGERSNYFGSLAFIILIAFIVIAFVTLYNVFALEIRGIKAVPFAVTLLSSLAKIPGIEGSSVGNTINNIANSSN